jgi:hypothetical protein
MKLKVVTSPEVVALEVRALVVVVALVAAVVVLASHKKRRVVLVVVVVAVVVVDLERQVRVATVRQDVVVDVVEDAVVEEAVVRGWTGEVEVTKAE